MPYDDPNKRLYRPDFGQMHQQEWVQFPEEEEINMAPAASSLKQQFMRKPPMSMGTGDTPMPTSLPEMDMGGQGIQQNLGGEAMKGKGIKSL